MRNTILLRGDLDRGLDEDVVASAAITPGDAIEFGGANDIQRQSTGAETPTVPWFALENPWREPAGATKNIDDDYAAGELVRAYVPQRGDLINAWLADGEDASADGTLLEYAGAGALQVRTTGQAIARVPKGQGVNNSSGAKARIVVEAL